MARTLPTLLPTDLERRLLRKGVGDLTAGRAPCADCGRTPLTGELIHLYGPSETVCELCSPMRAESPDASERVRHSEFGMTVKVRAA